jgi:hypothetical protein
MPGSTTSDCREIVAADGGLYLNYDDALFFKGKDSPPVLLVKDTTNETGYFCSQLSKMRGRVYAFVQRQLFELAAGKMHLLIDSIPAWHFFNYTIDSGNICWINISGKGLYKYELLPQRSELISIYKYDSHTAGFPFIDNQLNLWITSYEGLIKVLLKIFEDITPPKKTASAVSQEGNNLTFSVEDNGIERAHSIELKKQSATELYSSKGIDITEKRLINFNKSKEPPVIYNDLRDNIGNTTGTHVIIIIKRQ